MDYSEFLRNYRKKNFLTQTELAALLGVSFSTVNRWETGKFKPTLKTKKKIYDLLIKAKNGGKTL